MSKKQHTRELAEKVDPKTPAEQIIISADDESTGPGESTQPTENAPDEIDEQDETIRFVESPPRVRDVTPPPKEWVQAKLAFYMVGILFITIIIHYSAAIVLAFSYAKQNPDQNADQFEQHFKPISHIFNTLLPILSGLVSSAITYYFTREIQSAEREPNQPQ